VLLSGEPALLGSIFAVYLTAVVSPGPNTFIVTRLALAEGRRPASIAVLGIALGNLCWLTLVLGGAHLLFERVPGFAMVLRVVAGVYIAWLGVRALRAAVKGGDVMTRADGSPPSGSSFRAGLITSLTNPNTLPFYLSLLGVTVAPEEPLWVRFAAAGGVLALCVLWYGGLAVGFSSDTVQAAYRRWTRAINLLLAGLLLVFAGRLLLGGR
jgi:threonine/homoserine/homoserine lactone efflux protein